MTYDLTELVDDLPTEALELYVMEYEGPGVGDYAGCTNPLGMETEPPFCRCPRASLGYRYVSHRFNWRPMNWRIYSFFESDHPADIIEVMAHDGLLDTEALYRACKAAILARDAAVERVREEVGVG